MEIGIFKDDGTTRIGVSADKLEDTFPEYKGNILWGEHDAFNVEGTLCPQNIGVQFQFLLWKAMQELKIDIDILKLEVQSPKS